MSYEVEDKMVSHPDHYKSGQYEVIDIIDEFTKDLKGTEAVCTANAIKYILRWKKKNGIQDIKKAIWYLTHLAEYLENKCRECIDADYSINADEGCEGCVFAKKPEAKEYAEEEESDLSVEIHTNVAGVTVPDSEPWISNTPLKVCETCRYRHDGGHEEPCCHCNVIDPGEWDSRWTPNDAKNLDEEWTNEPSSEPLESSEDEHTCHNCGYHLRKHDLEPCKSCNWYSNWKPKE